ncbi:MAG: endonuclease MutS2 [bacterium]|nr:endonuclease MutS2 [bacterium]
MDVQTIRTLEFDRIQGILKRYAASSPGLAEIEELAIQFQPDRIQHLLDCVREMRGFLQNHEKPGLQGNREIRPLLEQLRIPGSLIGPAELLDVLTVIRTAAAVKHRFSREPDAFPLLYREVDGIEVFNDLKGEIEKIIDDRGEIRDAASEALAKIRREKRRAREKIRTNLDAILSSRRLEPVIQERLVTVRNNRYVIPLKPDFATRIEGIIHDRSSTGLTVYVEPSSTVDLNNRVSRLASEEEAEIRRILLMITDRIRGAASGLTANVEAMARLDLHLAKALFAEDFGGVNPEITGAPMVRFRSARHPLLLDRGGRKDDTIVPVDLELGETFSTLIITGPNTGGKTVALKTLGLLVLMTQAGIPIPVAEGSAMGVYTDVGADIGDEQSIQDDLSTFSSHVSNIVAILKRAGYGTLVLLDELGTGTDPREGAALGIALLGTLAEKGCHVAATTHFEEIKRHAYIHDRMMVASVAFDGDRLCPAYRLEYGHLGTSRAFEISARLGMPREMIVRAQSELSDTDRNMAQFINELEANIRESDAVRRSLERRRQEADAACTQRDRESDRMRREAAALEAEAAQALSEIKERSAELLRMAEQQNRARLERELSRMEEDLKSFDVVLPPPPVVQQPRLEKGATVEIVGTGKEALVVDFSVRKGRAQVVCDQLKLEVPLDRLQPVAPVPEDTEVQLKLDRTIDSVDAISPSINLVGLRADEARRKTEAYIDEAHLGQLRHIQIIHGFGTGTLRAVVAETLRSHPLVARFRSGGSEEGGGGVTVVELAS